MVYQRFSPQEQHGCSAGGTTNVIASLLAGAEAGTDSENQAALNDYQRECKLGAQQEAVIEKWAKAVGLWIDSVDELFDDYKPIKLMIWRTFTDTNLRAILA